MSILSPFISIAPPTDITASKGELVVLGIAELTASALRAHNEVEASALNAVMKALEAGRALTTLKTQVPHGSFEDFVAAHFPFTIRTAQSYMRLAKQEAKVRQLVEAKAKLGSRLTTKDALKYLNSVSDKKRR